MATTRRVAAAVLCAGILAAGVVVATHKNEPPAAGLPCPGKAVLCRFTGADQDQIVRSEGVVSQFWMDGRFEALIYLGYGAPTTYPHYLGTWQWSGTELVALVTSIEERFVERPDTGETKQSERVADPPLRIIYRRGPAANLWVSSTDSSELHWMAGLKWICD